MINAKFGVPFIYHLSFSIYHFFASTAGVRAGNPACAPPTSEEAPFALLPATPGYGGFGYLGGTPASGRRKMIHRLRPSAVARRSVDVLRKRHAPRASAFSIGGCAKSDQGESTPTVKSLLSCRGPWVTSTLTLRRRLAARSRGGRARQGKRATVSAGDNAQWLCGKIPRARNQRRGVSDESGRAISQVWATPIDPHPRPPALWISGRADELAIDRHNTWVSTRSTCTKFSMSRIVRTWNVHSALAACMGFYRASGLLVNIILYRL